MPVHSQENEQWIIAAKIDNGRASVTAHGQAVQAANERRKENPSEVVLKGIVRDGNAGLLPLPGIAPQPVNCVTIEPTAAYGDPRAISKLLSRLEFPEKTTVQICANEILPPETKPPPVTYASLPGDEVVMRFKNVRSLISVTIGHWAPEMYNEQLVKRWKAQQGQE